VIGSSQRTVFDTGPIVAALDRADRYHHACAQLIATTPGVLLLPVPVIVEAAQLAHTRLGVAAEAAFTESIAREQQFTIISPTEETLARAAVLIGQYADLRLGLVDACVIALAERLDATHIATLNRRHFTVVRPQHVVAFTLLPA
jgi:predicted nucleic acid-binding protein